MASIRLPMVLTTRIRKQATPKKFIRSNIRLRNKFEPNTVNAWTPTGILTNSPVYRIPVISHTIIYEERSVLIVQMFSLVYEIFEEEVFLFGLKTSDVKLPIPPNIFIGKMET